MSDAEFRSQLQASGMSYDELRHRARMDLEKAMMIEQEVRGKIDVPDADTKAYYDSHQADFTITKERLRLSQILIALPPNATPAQVAAAQKKGLEKLSLAEMRAVEPRISQEVFAVLGVENSVRSRTSFGGTAPKNVRAQARLWLKRLK